VKRAFKEVTSFQEGPQEAALNAPYKSGPSKAWLKITGGNSVQLMESSNEREGSCCHFVDRRCTRKLKIRG
jgi:hypothetical protein